MKFEFKVALRYLGSGHKNRFISIVTFISVLGVAVGVMTLIIVLSVMSGFDSDLREKIVSVNPHVYVFSQEGISAPYALSDELEKLKHVEGASPFIEGQALIKRKKQVQGILLRGIDAQREIKVTRLKDYLAAGDLPEDNEAILLGSELARIFGLSIGDSIVVVSPVKQREHTFRVAGIFNSGMYDYDASFAYINLAKAQEFFDIEELVSGIGVRVDDLFKAKDVKKQILKDFGFRYWVRTWMEINKNLFSSLRLEKTVMFIILTLIVLVACFNIISTLIMTVMEKTKEIGILKSLGASRKQISGIFTFCGLIIGILGTLLGAGIGFYACYLLKTYEFIKLPADIYYIDKLPVEIQWNDSILIAVCAVVISLLATIYPAYKAARLNPVEALRYE